ncbi:MAG: DUF1440 domain-containing protein [Deinococcota bacterium]|nr:DUF1440 domain-containing protein [Deinococcota bacterium]
MERLLKGALAGLLATVPMTLAMTAMHRALPEHEQYPLPPKRIAMKLADEVGIKDDLDEGERNALTMVAHFDYGATVGALYGLAERSLPGSPAVKGVGFGLAVWTVSYLGLLPAAGILRSATEQPPRRNALMIAAHLVWGASLGLGYERLRR